jgi:hypothetical protein
MELDAEAAGGVELLSDVLADALPLAAIGAVGAVRLVVDLSTGQLARKGLALGLSLGGCGFARERLCHRSQVRLDRFLEQVGMLQRQAFSLDPEAPALVQRQLVGELIDLGLAQGEFPVLRDEQLAQGVGVEFMEVGRESHAQIMPPASPCAHSGIPRWCTVCSFESHRHRLTAAKVGLVLERRTWPGRA